MSKHQHALIKVHPWETTESYKIIKSTDEKLFKKYKKEPNNINKTTYQQAKLGCINEYNKQKKEYNECIIESSKGTPFEFYNLKRKKSITNIINAVIDKALYLKSGKNHI